MKISEVPSPLSRRIICRGSCARRRAAVSERKKRVLRITVEAVYEVGGNGVEKERKEERRGERERERERERGEREKIRVYVAPRGGREVDGIIGFKSSEKALVMCLNSGDAAAGPAATP